MKIKLGKDGKTDLLRVQMIREAVGGSLRLRIDANQGWDFETARDALIEMGIYDIEFCEQPMRSWNDHLLPKLRAVVSYKNHGR